MQNTAARQPEPEPVTELVDGEEKLIALLVADLLVRTPQLATWRDDLAHDAGVHYQLQRQGYRGRGGASPATYLRTVVGNYLRDVRSAQLAARRGGGSGPLSLDEPVSRSDAGGTVARHELVPGSLDTAEEALAAVARDRALARLSPEQRRIARAYEAGASTAAIAQGLGLARTTVDEERQRIRAAFTAESFAPPRSRRATPARHDAARAS